jgi:hypothetical protein
MSTAYAKVIESAPLSADSQGEGNEAGALWVLLSALDSVDTRGDTYPSNPATEVKSRLSPWNKTRWMAEFAVPLLTSLELKFAQR